MLTTDVVKARIPLLLSVSVMEKAGMVIDCDKREIPVHGRKVPLKKLASGHLVLLLNL